MTQPVAPVQVGEVLAGKYRVDRVLGAGGMGVVVAATHVDLEQRVAIKFLLPEALANQEVVERFSREARAAVKIQSEHVARVIDVGRLEGGAPYIVMEYLEGTDLAHRIASEGRLSVADVVRYLLEACEALAEAHAAGIVHRDLKPANMFLARRADKTSMVKVLDFGISKSTVGGGGGITSTQAVMGSPYYMSPEQLMSAKHVDHRSDIWSLGIVLYEALAGSPPYQADTMPEIVARILQAPPPRVRELRADVPVEVDDIVARCLAKDPKDRFRDVAELAKALAPLSSEGGRSMERISRVLGASLPPEQTVTGNAPMPASMTAVMASRQQTPTPQITAKAATTSPEWSQTQAAGVPKKPNLLWAGVGVAGVLGIGAIAFVATRSHGDDSSSSQAAHGIVVTAEATTLSSTAVVPLPPPATATTTETPLATAANTTTAAVAHTTRAAAGPKPSATTKPSATVAATTPPPPPPTATQTSQPTLHMGIK